MELENFGITKEIYDRNESVFYLLINTTHEPDQDPKGEAFQALYNKVHGNWPNKQNVSDFLKEEAIQILWNAEGTPDFPGYSRSKELKERLDNLVNTKINKPFSDQNYKTIRNHFLDIQENYQVGY